MTDMNTDERIRKIISVPESINIEYQDNLDAISFNTDDLCIYIKHKNDEIFIHQFIIGFAVEQNKQQETIMMLELLITLMKMSDSVKQEINTIFKTFE